MPPRKDTKSEVVKNAIRRFPNLGNQTIARHLLATHGDLFDNDLEKIRDRVRYLVGSKGSIKRASAIDKSLFRTSIREIPQSWRKKRKPYRLPVGLWLVLSDVHVPFHEIKPIESAIQAGQAEKVDGVFLNGDFQDCASVSFWPQAHRDFNGEIELSIDVLDFLRHEFPKQKIVYKPGNHEYRLPRVFIQKVPELAESPLAAMETVMGFAERDIDFLDYYQLVYAGKLAVLHGHEVPNLNRTVNPARGLFLKTKTSAACSHCHSISGHTTTDVSGNEISTWSFGCLCTLSPDYNPFCNDWSWGFAFINIEKNGNFEVINRRILRSGKVV